MMRPVLPPLAQHRPVAIKMDICHAHEVVLDDKGKIVSRKRITLCKGEEFLQTRGSDDHPESIIADPHRKENPLILIENIYFERIMRLSATQNAMAV